MILCGVPNVEVSLVAVFPWKGITDAIILGELHIVRGGEPFVVALVAAAIWHAIVVLVAQGTLRAKEASIHKLLLLALFCECCYDGGYLVTQGNQWTHHILDRLETAGDIRHGELFLCFFCLYPQPTPYSGG
jgi:hypothetical protein